MPLPDSATLATYGGIKQNDQPIEDYSTDEDANDRNEFVADTAGMTHTAWRAWRAFVTSATVPTDPTSAIHDTNWGDDVLRKAVVARTSTGIFTVTYPTTITDELGIVHTLNLRRATWNLEGATPFLVTATVTSPNVVTVRVFTLAGALTDAVGTTITVFVT